MDSRYKQDGPLSVYTCKLSGRHGVEARIIGGGNFSEGMRLAIEFAYAAGVGGAARKLDKEKMPP